MSSDVPAVDAATIVLVRDAASGGIEVLLLERHIDSDFAGGALVFPGGKVDVADRELDPSRWSVGDLDAWSTVLGVTSDADALGLLVAGVRETFEEVGLLFARRSDGSWVTAEDLSSPPFRDARQHLATRGQRWDWRPFLAAQGLTLDLDALAMWSWWVTPRGQHKRFDTRFLIARALPGQIAAHDDVEATGVAWMQPEDALSAHEQGQATVIFPTRRNLEALARFPDAGSAWAAARDGEVDARRIEPTILQVDGRVMVQHPFEDEPSIV